MTYWALAGHFLGICWAFAWHLLGICWALLDQYGTYPQIQNWDLPWKRAQFIPWWFITTSGGPWSGCKGYWLLPSVDLSQSRSVTFRTHNRLLSLALRPNRWLVGVTVCFFWTHNHGGPSPQGGLIPNNENSHQVYIQPMLPYLCKGFKKAGFT